MAPDALGDLEFLAVPASPEIALATLAEPARRWFAQRFGAPTLGQRVAWPAIAAGKNVLLCAPTGSGKTLAAFLPVLSGLFTSFSSGVRCLYLAPLKALGNDTRRNLRRHIREIVALTPETGVTIRVGLRTGDTPARTRRSLLREPPDILLTTPESLAVLLTQRPAVELFGGLRQVIVDEVHALVENKRGADLALSLERLDEMTGGGLQRIGLSATCAPLETAARFLVGARRPCTIAEVGATAPLRLIIEPLADSRQEPAAAGESPPRGGFVSRLVERLLPELEANRTTLIFTNVRSLAERLAWRLRERLPELSEQIAVHHSSLAAARRRLVERALKQGRLRAVVSSTSLELGIDVGSVEGVVLVHPPGGVVRLLQRVGRAGHGPGRVRRGLVLTATAAELLEAAVTGASSQSRQYEALRVPAHPLDVLCQHLLGMAAQRPWTAPEALKVIRCAYPYRDIPERDFRDCLDYLSGLDGEGRSWLPTRLRWEGDEFWLVNERTARLLRRNLGTILAEEPRRVRLESGGAVGQVDEAFADRLQPGDRFLLDGRCLEFRRMEDGAALVQEVPGRPQPPRWAGEAWPLASDLARRLYLLRTRAAEALLLGRQALAELLEREYGLRGGAVTTLVEHFLRQEALSEIPEAATCLVECVRRDYGAEYYVHTDLNRAGNDALARVAVLRLVRERGRTAGSQVADLGLLLGAGGGADLTPDDLRRLFAAEDFEADLAAALAGSYTLRERFRRVAQTGLMLLRNPLGARRRVGGPDWGEQRLFDQVRAARPDFVLLRQALREVRGEGCDGAAALAYARSLPRRMVRCRWLARPSPFAEGWTQEVLGPVEQPDSPGDALQRLQEALLGGTPEP